MNCTCGKSDNRYQFQPWYVRTYRWWRYMPFGYANGMFRLAWWILRGAKPCDELPRRETARMIWVWYKSIAEKKMNFYWTLQEVKDELELED